MKQPASKTPRIRALARVLQISALYDLAAFAVLMAMPRWLFSLFHHPLPCDAFLFRLAALPLLLLPLVYLTAAEAAQRCPVLVDLSIALRITGALALAGLILWQRPAGAGAYGFFAVGDVVWAGLYLLFARRAVKSQ